MKDECVCVFVCVSQLYKLEQCNVFIWMAVKLLCMWGWRMSPSGRPQYYGHLQDSCSRAVMHQWNHMFAQTRTLECFSQSLKHSQNWERRHVVYELSAFSTSLWLMAFETGELVQCGTSFCLRVSSPSSSWQPPESPSLCNQLLPAGWLGR